MSDDSAAWTLPRSLQGGTTRMEGIHMSTLRMNLCACRERSIACHYEVMGRVACYYAGMTLRRNLDACLAHESGHVWLGSLHLIGERWADLHVILK